MAFVQHTLQNQHEYGQMNCIITLLKPPSSPSMLIPYEQYYIQTLHQEGKLILEQYPGKLNPLFQTAINHQPPHTTWKNQSCFSLQPGHYSSLTAPNFQHTANQEWNDQCGNQHHSRKTVMMGIVFPESCQAYKKYNKIIGSI